MKTLKACFFSLFLMQFSISIISQCTIATELSPSANKSVSDGSRIGQIFTACEDGFIESIGIQVALYTNPSIELYVGIRNGGLLTGPYQSFPMPFLPGPSGYTTFILDPPLPVLAGTQYEFQVENGTLFELGISDEDIPGNCTINGAIVASDIDLAIEVKIVPDTFQCIIATELSPSANKSVSDGSRIGQIFTACEDGFIESIGIQVALYTNPSIELYVGIPNGGLLPGPYQSFPMPFLPGPSGYTTFILDPPLPVLAGTQYEFQVENGTLFELGISDEDIPGNCTINGAIVASDIDLAMRIRILPSPFFTKEFAENEVNQFQNTTLTFNIDNTFADVVGENISFIDNLPAGLEVAVNPNINNSCGGSIMISPENNSISFSGGTIGEESTCSISVDVTLKAQGKIVNTSGDMTSNLGNSGSATATVLGLVPIPTLTQWGIVLLLLIMLIFGVTHLSNQIHQTI